MPDGRRTYGGGGGGGGPPNTTAAAKPAYFYYSPQAQHGQQLTPQQQQQPQYYIPQQQKMTVIDEGGFHGQSPKYGGKGSPRMPAKATKKGKQKQDQDQMTTFGDFRQQPDGTIVLVQPAPVDPYASRIKCAKFFIFGSNVILLIVGLSFLALGAYLKADDRFRDLLSENFRQVTSKEIDPVLYVGTYIIIAVALVMIIVSFFGCCGAILDNQCLLVLYFIFLMVAFFMQISVLALALMKKEKIENDVGEALDYMVQHYYQGPGMITDVMDMLQMTFRCCGNSGCADYSQFRMNVPRSCDTACDGCRFRMFRFFKDGFTVIGVAMAFTFVAEVLAVSFSMYLCCFMRMHPTTRRRYFYYKAADPTKQTQKVAGTPTRSPQMPIKKPL